jgi:hypothetical protein
MSIFSGYGNISFENEATYSSGPSSSPYSLAVGYFNNDSRLDIAVTNYGGDNVGISLGYGNGLFANQTTYLTGPSSSPYSLAVSDFNNDTILYIFVAYYGNNELGVFLGHGDGTFSNVILFPMKYGSRIHSLLLLVI